MAAAGDRVTIEIGSEARLFAAVDDPFSEGFDVVSGMERIIEATSARRDLGSGMAGLTIALPPQAATETSAPRIAAAIGRYCAAETADIGRRIEMVRREGLQTLWLGLGFGLVCMALFLALERLGGEGSILRRMAEVGLVVAGWVALWRPVDLLLYERWLLRRKARVLEAIARAPVSVAARD